MGDDGGMALEGIDIAALVVVSGCMLAFFVLAGTRYASTLSATRSRMACE